VEVSCSEGVASRTGPESCAVHREVRSEALTGESIGQPLSRDSKIELGADVVKKTEGNKARRVKASVSLPGVVRDSGMCRRSLIGNREVSCLAVEGL
jgi:hypothetical protein